jgi:protein ImuB
MLWAALLLPNGPDATPPSDDALRGLATWALQFTPRVAVSGEAVLLEVEASVRLFGGKRALRDRVVQEGADLGVTAIAWATTSLGAHALARAGIENGFQRPLEELLDGLSMGVLTAVGPHHATLARLGCQTLGDIRRLPRGGISRRFDKDLLGALDRAYGLQPEAHVWVELADTFEARLELMSRVEMAPALLFGARRLLLQLCGWLAARHSGTTAFTLRWAHDTMRNKDAGEGGGLTIRTAAPTRHVEHLCRLLAENLAKVELLAPVGDLQVVADEVVALDEKSASLLPDESHTAESLQPGTDRGPSPRMDADVAACTPAAAEKAFRAGGHATADLGAAAAPEAGDARAATDVPGGAAAPDRSPPRRGRLVASPGRRRGGDHGSGPARLLGRAQRARRGAVDLQRTPGR